VSVSLGQQQCQHAGGPVRQSTIINFIKTIIEPYIPYHIPGIDIEIDSGFGFKAENIYLKSLTFTAANIQLSQPYTVLFSLSGLVSSLSLDWTLTNSGNVSTGSALLGITNAQGSITAFVEQDYFKNVASTFVVGDLTLTTSNQPVIEPYWELLKPIVVDLLQREIPNLFLEIDTQEIKSLVYPIVQSIEPIHLPDQNVTLAGAYGAITNMTLNGIDFDAATMGRGGTVDEVVFELLDVSALINNNWELRALGFDDSGNGYIQINSTTIMVSVGLGEDSQGEFTVNLDNAKIVIGGLSIHTNAPTILNFLIQALEPLIVAAVQSTFQTIVCILFNGIPS
jgi:hypothetical protein